VDSRHLFPAGQSVHDPRDPCLLTVGGDQDVGSLPPRYRGRA
jgi:hypothetical protein